MITNEIEKAQRQVKTDVSQLFVREIVNIHKDGELVINPEF